MIFISHAFADDKFVAELRRELEALRIPVWVDSRNLRGGSKLAPEIEKTIEGARHFVVVLSKDTVNSPWVRREIDKAVEVEKSRKEDGYRVIPLLLPGIAPAALGTWFDEEPVGVRIEVGPGGLMAALPALLAALGEQLPDDLRPFAQPEAGLVEELVLELADPKIETAEGKRRATATAQLVYEPAEAGARRIESRRFAFTAPLGPIEAANLRWYLETYYIWPDTMAQARAEELAGKLPGWGLDLYRAAQGSESAREVLAAWQAAATAVPGAGSAERRFSVQVDRDLPDGSSKEAQLAAGEAATELLALPWELLHDGRTWLFQGASPVRVRRRLPNRAAQPARPTKLPIRILLVSPRPEIGKNGDRIGYIDHRVSARPLVEAVESLGALAHLTVLQPPTYGALETALQEEAHRGEGFDVVHFDGHGVYDRHLGLGGLCFEDPGEEEKLEERRLDFVDAVRLAGLVREHRIPLVFLEACQTAVAEVDPTASVAGRLLEEGVASVVAMSHSVLVETARRFVQAFYAELANGVRVGRAMLAGQRALFNDSRRGKVLGAGELQLQDWFVPVLYQEELDPQLVTKTPPEQVKLLEAKKRQLSLGALPEPPSHAFQGRSRELLALERLLHREPWAVVRGTGGQGKTTLAVELARWLTRTGRFKKAAFVSLEHHRDAKAVLDTLGHQLLPEGEKYSVAQFPTFEEALQPVERALRDHATIVVLDNCESVLPERGELVAPEPTPDSPAPGAAPPPEEASAAIFALCQRLLDAGPGTRLVFTTREPLAAPFDIAGRERELGALDRQDAIELVSEVMKRNGWKPLEDDSGSTPQEVTDLVEAVHRHARALVLLAREVAQRGLKDTTWDLRSLMADLERKHPGDRENSLYASVELSLRRLPPQLREKARVLGVCQGGVHLFVLGRLTGLEPDPARQLATELNNVGLGKAMGHGHFSLDPGLSPYLLGELTTVEAEVLRSQWAEAMAHLTTYLHEELFNETGFSAHLTLMELPNLLSMLDWLEVRWPAESLVDLAAVVERLVQNLGRPQAMAKAARVCEHAVRKLGGWSHLQFVAESAKVNRRLQQGELTTALAGSQRLLARGLAAGEAAYPGAAYDLAMAYFLAGQVAKARGVAEEGLALLTEARRRLEEQLKVGDTAVEDAAEDMVAATSTEIGDCLRHLGRLEEAATACEEAINLGGKGNRGRAVAVGRAQLGALRHSQHRYREALGLYREARDSFEELREPLQVATAWHQIGMVHEAAGELEPAEYAYRRALAIRVRERDLPGQAAGLGQLGNLYKKLGRLEEAINFYRQSGELYRRLGDLSGEGKTRSNLADAFIKHKRYDEARQELQRAIETLSPCGHASESWKAWSVLEGLERSTGRAEGARAARSKAIEAYLAYRHAGGVSQSPAAQLFAQAAQALQQGSEAEMQQQLIALLEPNDPQHFTALVRQLQAVLSGNRNSALAEDLELDYANAAELQLLLESLQLN